MLEVSGVHKAYGRNRVLAGVDMTIESGGVTALLGANGAGKSTLLSIVSGLAKADRGSVRIDGLDARDPSTRRLLGVAPQTLGIYPTMSTRRNMELFGRLAGLRHRELDAAVDRMATTMGLDDLMDHRAGELSGGQKRRLHTAMAMVANPRLLLLDEPTVGADVTSRNQIIDVVRSLADSGCAVCYTTHHLSEIEQLGATLAVLRDGRILAAGSLREVAAEAGMDDKGANAGRIEQIYHHFVGQPPPDPVDQTDTVDPGERHVA